MTPSATFLSHDAIEASYWPTPQEAVTPEFAALIRGIKFAEICAGNGKLVRWLSGAGATCVWASDIYPRHRQIAERDCFDTTAADLHRAECVITNPPFSSNFTYRFIDHVLHMNKPLWLFLPADFAYRRTSGFVMPFCSTIAAVGPVKFIEDSKSKGETQFAWYKFVPYRTATVFLSRAATFNSTKVPDRLKEKIHDTRSKTTKVQKRYRWGRDESHESLFA